MYKKIVPYNLLPEYLKGFSEAQREVIFSKEDAVQVIAGAGSGKTRTVVGLVEHNLRSKNIQVQGKQHLLLLSFSRKAVEEMKTRIPSDLYEKVEISTFHAFCLRYLPKIYPRTLAKLNILTEEKKQQFFYDYFWETGSIHAIGGIPLPLFWQQPLSFAIAFPVLYEQTKKALQRYKYKNNLFEFEDLIDMMLDILRKNKKRVQFLRKKYSMIIVDEFQDTDSRQLDFLRFMQAKRKTVVGDDWQASYAFRGASLTPFLTFADILQARKMQLFTIYRSLKAIVDIGSHIIKASHKQIDKKVNAIRNNSPQLPILTLNIEENPARELITMMHRRKTQLDSYRFLTRTNWQRDFWSGLGIAEECAMTIHKSKGLEFPVVFLDLCGGWNSCCPKNKEKSQNKQGIKKRIQEFCSLPLMNGNIDTTLTDEEIRILYVGASRAMNLLVILHLNEESAGEKEYFYYSRLIKPYAQACDLDNLGGWLDKEYEFRKTT